MFLSDDLNETRGNVVDVDSALMYKLSLSEFGVVRIIPPCCLFSRSDGFWHIV